MIIKCPECGKEISDMANACVYCGMPIELTQNIRVGRTNGDIGRGFRYGIGGCLMIIVVFMLVSLFFLLLLAGVFS